MSSGPEASSSDKMVDILSQINQLISVSKTVEETDNLQLLLNKLVENAEKKLETQKKLLASLQLLDI